MARVRKPKVHDRQSDFKKVDTSNADSSNNNQSMPANRMDSGVKNKTIKTLIPKRKATDQHPSDEDNFKKLKPNEEREMPKKHFISLQFNSPVAHIVDIKSRELNLDEKRKETGDCGSERNGNKDLNTVGTSNAEPLENKQFVEAAPIVEVLGGGRKLVAKQKKNDAHGQQSASTSDNHNLPDINMNTEETRNKQPGIESGENIKKRIKTIKPVTEKQKPKEKIQSEDIKSSGKKLKLAEKRQLANEAFKKHIKVDIAPDGFVQFTCKIEKCKFEKISFVLAEKHAVFHEKKKIKRKKIIAKQKCSRCDEECLCTASNLLISACKNASNSSSSIS